MKKTLLSLVVIGSFIAPLAALDNNEACQKEDRFHSYYLPRIKVQRELPVLQSRVM